MRINTKDETLKRNYLQKYQFLVEEYEVVKSGRHKKYKLVSEFYKAHGTCRQTFLKYYVRYKNSGEVLSLMPGKRGPKYRTRSTPEEIEHQVISLREKGCNKFEINDILKPKLLAKTPSPSTIYNILRRHGINRKTKAMQEEKRKIIEEKLGELGHIDCRHLSKDTIANDSNRYYLLCIIDSCSRIAWVEVTKDVKALTVMLATLHCFNYIANYYDIKFAEVLTDNGP